MRTVEDIEQEYGAEADWSAYSAWLDARHDNPVVVTSTAVLQALLAMRDELVRRDAVIAGLMHDYGEYINSMDMGAAETISDIMTRIVAAVATPQGQEVQSGNLVSKPGAEWHAVSLDLVNHALGICASIYGEMYLSFSALWERIDATREGRDYDDIIGIALNDAECRMIDGARNFAKYQHRDS